MKRLLLAFVASLSLVSVDAQITITASDVPVSGDTLRMSTAAITGSGFSVADSGASHTWDFSTLTPRSQVVDKYQSALSVSVTYLLISVNAYGYKVADSFPGGSALPVSITDLYTFFEKQSSNTKYSAVAFAAKISGVPTPFNYTKDDMWYRFPMNYGNTDSTPYALNISLVSVASIKQSGYRKTKVDGWGTVKTPYYSTPVNCLRVRSEIRGVDSVKFGTAAAFPIPRNTVEYKWLVNGDHYPAVWIVTNVTGTTETVSSVRYRDTYQQIGLGVGSTQTATPATLTASPNPSTGLVQLDIPSSWLQYSVEVFDMTGRVVLTASSQPAIDLSNLAKGQYVGRVMCGTKTSYVQLVKE